MLYLFGTGVTSRQMASYPCCVFDEWEMKDHPTHMPGAWSWEAKLLWVS